MSLHIQVIREKTQSAIQTSLAYDVQRGFRVTPKYIPCTYFYDNNGSRIFQEIMNMPEYYLNDCEQKILESHKEEIASFVENSPFRLVELGAGDGRKTQILLKHFQERNLDFEYVPIDISRTAMKQLVGGIADRFPNLPTNAMVCEYKEGLDSLQKNGRHNFVIFLGSSLGNFSMKQAESFCQQLANSLSPGDLFLLGVDLVKDPKILLDAYSDQEGITERFNLNLLHRINQELGANFDVNCFQHHANYDPVEKTMKSYLLSRKDQKVKIEKLNEEFHFATWEPIHTEYSWKYNLEDIEQLAKKADFRIRASFTEERNYFLESLWELNGQSYK